MEFDYEALGGSAPCVSCRRFKVTVVLGLVTSKIGELEPDDPSAPDEEASSSWTIATWPVPLSAASLPAEGNSLVPDQPSPSCALVV